MNHSLPMPLVELHSGSASCIISPWGGQVLGWRIGSEKILYENPAAILDGSKPIRAGIPVCFPWFAKGVEVKAPTLLEPMHGHVRTMSWERISQTASELSLSVTTTSYDGGTLVLAMTYSIARYSLTLQADVKNIGSTNASYDLALHTYFATERPQNISISGMCKNDPFTPSLPIDKVFMNAKKAITVELKERSLTIENENFAKSVVWNPGEQKPVDLPTIPSIPEFICIESLTAPMTLPAGGSSSGSVTYKPSHTHF